MKGGAENEIYLSWGSTKIKAVDSSGNQASAEDVQRTTKDGKTSAVHFLKFIFTEDQKKEFAQLTANIPVIFSVEHPKYNHMTRLSAETIIQLKNDLQ